MRDQISQAALWPRAVRIEETIGQRSRDNHRFEVALSLGAFDLSQFIFRLWYLSLFMGREGPSRLVEDMLAVLVGTWERAGDSLINTYILAVLGCGLN